MLKISRYISILLLVNFLPFVIPKEYIHELFGHEDSLDRYHSDLTFEKAHKHCGILQITTSSFVRNSRTVLTTGSLINIACILPVQNFIAGISYHISLLRAPPEQSI